jgi:hypothetical protein
LDAFALVAASGFAAPLALKGLDFSRANEEFNEALGFSP